MLAHKAVHEGKVAAEVCGGHKRFFDARVIPSVAYTDPEVAWVGADRDRGEGEGHQGRQGRVPLGRLGAVAVARARRGLTKLIFDHETDRVIGAGIVGPSAGDLIAEVALAIEMGAMPPTSATRSTRIPTLSETVNFAAEMFEGTITDLMPPKKK
jgi:dihydrolipoamide dehydrogenase